MNSQALVILVLVCIGFLTTKIVDVESLIFSRYTLFQVVCAVSWPIPYKNPLRKLFFNVGFQFNYGEPFALSNFYNATFFSNALSGREIKSNDGCNEGRVPSKTNELMGRDLTAAQLYESIENNLFSFGYDRNCLLKSICELARHPLHHDDPEEHIVGEILHFVLTPTEHSGFSDDEKYEREKYETAQRIGENGGDCHAIYSECENSFLDRVSYIVQ